MSKQDIASDCIKYCMIKARNDNKKDALKKIAKALYQCDMSDKSIHECIVLLKILEE